MEKPNGWNEWSRHVLAELKRLNTCYETLDDKIDKLKEDVTVLKVKAWLFGVFGGGAIMVVIEIIRNLLVK